MKEVGEVRLLGGAVPRGRGSAANDYLTGSAQGKSLRISVTAELDPERHPLVLFTLKDGTLLNAALIQEGLAIRWKRPGVCHTWTRRPLSHSP